MYVLENIPFNLDLDQMLNDLRLTGRQKLAHEFLELTSEAETIAKPKALFHKLELTEKGDRHVILGGEKLESRVLRVNLDGNRFAFAALATCGIELYEWAASKSNILSQFWAKAITDAALSNAVEALESNLKEQNSFETVSIMTPGSISDWPISQQSVIFQLIGESATQIGVSLTDSFLMVPVSTISCLLFESESRFYSCQLCPRSDCQSRRAPYNERLLSEKYKIDVEDTADSIPICES